MRAVINLLLGMFESIITTTYNYHQYMYTYISSCPSLPRSVQDAAGKQKDRRLPHAPETRQLYLDPPKDQHRSEAVSNRTIIDDATSVDRQETDYEEKASPQSQFLTTAVPPTCKFHPSTYLLRPQCLYQP
jgi:hypothetical protein